MIARGGSRYLSNLRSVWRSSAGSSSTDVLWMVPDDMSDTEVVDGSVFSAFWSIVVMIDKCCKL